VPTERNRRRRTAARPGPHLAIALCVAVGILSTTSGAALGISGYATNGPAVNAQYPDDASNTGSGRGPVISSLGSLMRFTRKAQRGSEHGARWHAEQQQITRRMTTAVVSAAGLDARQSGSIALLATGMAVLCVGGFLRWRRGRSHV